MSPTFVRDLQPPVLVVGGERHIVRLIEVNLRRQGYEVVAVRSINALLIESEKAEFNSCVLTGEIDGISLDDLEARIRSEPKLVDTQIIRH